MTRPRRGSDDLPIVIKEAGKAVERDIKPTLNLLGRIFLGGAAPPPKPEPVQYEPERPRPVRLPSSRSLAATPPQQIVISQVRRSDEQNGSHIIEGELIEGEIPRICPTCGGTGRLGKAGYEVPCPSCNWPKDGHR